MKKESGFTLIEILAVIIILGIVTTVAVIGVSKYINSSRKSVYIESAKSYIEAMKVEISKGKFNVKRKDTTYYIHIGNVEMERDAKSPFGEWKEAYVVLTNNENSTNYYWTSIDMAGQKVDAILENALSEDSVYFDPNNRVNYNLPLDSKMNIIIIDKDGKIVKGAPSEEWTREQADRCFSYQENLDNTIAITYYNSGCGSTIVIPGYIDGMKVVEIYSYAFRDTGLTKVIIPGTVTTIGTRAFSYNNLVDVNIPSNVKTIGNEAFMANKINNLTLNEGLITLGLKAFFRNQISDYLIPESVTSIGSCVFCENPISRSAFIYPKLDNGEYDYTTIRGYIGDLKEFPDKRFIIPAEKEGVKLKVIQSNFVQGLPLSGWEVVIPSTVTHIGSTAFWGCYISKVNFPEGLKRIDTAAFYVNSINELVIPSSVEYIGSYAFNNNRVADPEQAIVYKRTSSGVDYSTIISYAGANRNNVVIPEVKNGVALKRIEENAFSYISLTGTIKIPNSVNYIGPRAFAIGYLTHVDNGDGVLNGPFIYKRLPEGGYDNTTIIGYASRRGTVVIPSQVKKIEDWSFYYTHLDGVIFPEGLETIGIYAFANCYLKDITIPSTVTSIGPYAFYKVRSYTDYNIDLKRIINKTGKAFNWRSITGSQYPATFEEGIVRSWYGDIRVVK